MKDYIACVDFEELETRYTPEQIKDIIDVWNLRHHPYTCSEGHGDLVYHDHALCCKEPKCAYHQHWIYQFTVDYYEIVRSIRG